ncbi:MC034 [Molluscum contagiosum virus subtype 2]|uniref:MC034 n=1 Tax=Molluscum contagiosum virus subtype 2 TaxID=10281 RepID=A0A3G2VKB6_MCV2|nr:MC034 [Molluscum contagiosum virus subtype 2]
MEIVNPSPESPSAELMASIDMREVLARYVEDADTAERLLRWATDKAAVYYLRNISNSKANIEETKFETANNIGIEYSKDHKNKLSYRNKPLIPTNLEYEYLCDLIKSTSGSDKETLRYLLFGIKCVRARVEYDIDKLPDYNYDKYFHVLNEQSSAPCPVCRGRNTTPMILQTRASDEEPTVRYVCKDCNKHFSPPKFLSPRGGHADLAEPAPPEPVPPEGAPRRQGSHAPAAPQKGEAEHVARRPRVRAKERARKRELENEEAVPAVEAATKAAAEAKEDAPVSKEAARCLEDAASAENVAHSDDEEPSDEPGPAPVPEVLSADDAAAAAAVADALDNADEDIARGNADARDASEKDAEEDAEDAEKDEEDAEDAEEDAEDAEKDEEDAEDAEEDAEDAEKDEEDAEDAEENADDDDHHEDIAENARVTRGTARDSNKPVTRDSPSA